MNALAVVRVLLGIAVLASLSAQPAAAWVLAGSDACASTEDGCESRRSPQVAACTWGRGLYVTGDVRANGAAVEWGPNDHCEPAQHDRITAGCGGFDGGRVGADVDFSDGGIVVYFPFVGRDSPRSGYGLGTQSAGACN